jgi:hypothetical protein
VFVDVLRGAGLAGVQAWDLRLVDGRSVRAATVEVHNGTGDWSDHVLVSLDQAREVTLATAPGSTVATATPS